MPDWSVVLTTLVSILKTLAQEDVLLFGLIEVVSLRVGGGYYILSKAISDQVVDKLIISSAETPLLNYLV